MQFKSSKALGELLYTVSKVIEYKSDLVSKKQSIAVLEATKILWSDVCYKQISKGQESYFSSNLNGLGIESEDVIEKLSQTIISVSLKSDYPFIGKFWGRNLEVLSSHFESYNFSLPAGKLIEAHLDDLVAISKL